MQLDQTIPVPIGLKEKLGVLLQSKVLNPATFFSFDFSLGVWVPLVGPFIAPVGLTLFAVIKAKVLQLK